MSVRRPIRLAVMGQPELYRHGIALALQDYSEDLAVREIDSLAQQRDQADQVVLLALPVDPGGAVAFVADAAAALPEMPILAYTLSADPATWARLMNCGARGIVGPSASIEILVAALRLVAAGGAYLPPELITQSIAPRPPLGAGAASPTNAPLTGREHAILEMVGRSYTNQEIAAELGITETTVRVHVRNLRQKLRARSRVDLALLAVQMPR